MSGFESLDRKKWIVDPIVGFSALKILSGPDTWAHLEPITLETDGCCQVKLGDTERDAEAPIRFVTASPGIVKATPIVDETVDEQCEDVAVFLAEWSMGSREEMDSWWNDLAESVRKARRKQKSA